MEKTKFGLKWVYCSYVLCIVHQSSISSAANLDRFPELPHKDESTDMDLYLARNEHQELDNSKSDDAYSSSAEDNIHYASNNILGESNLSFIDGKQNLKSVLSQDINSNVLPNIYETNPQYAKLGNLPEIDPMSAELSTTEGNGNIAEGIEANIPDPEPYSESLSNVEQISNPYYDGQAFSLSNKNLKSAHNFALSSKKASLREFPVNSSSNSNVVAAFLKNSTALLHENSIPVEGIIIGESHDEIDTDSKSKNSVTDSLLHEDITVNDLTRNTYINLKSKESSSLPRTSVSNEPVVYSLVDENSNNNQKGELFNDDLASTNDELIGKVAKSGPSQEFYGNSFKPISSEEPRSHSLQQNPAIEFPAVSTTDVLGDNYNPEFSEHSLETIFGEEQEENNPVNNLFNEPINIQSENILPENNGGTSLSETSDETSFIGDASLSPPVYSLPENESILGLSVESSEGLSLNAPTRFNTEDVPLHPVPVKSNTSDSSVNFPDDDSYSNDAPINSIPHDSSIIDSSFSALSADSFPEDTSFNSILHESSTKVSPLNVPADGSFPDDESINPISQDSTTKDLSFNVAESAFTPVDTSINLIPHESSTKDYSLNVPGGGPLPGDASINPIPLELSRNDSSLNALENYPIPDVFLIDQSPHESVTASFVEENDGKLSYNNSSGDIFHDDRDEDTFNKNPSVIMSVKNDTMDDLGTKYINISAISPSTDKDYYNASLSTSKVSDNEEINSTSESIQSVSEIVDENFSIGVNIIKETSNTTRENLPLTTDIITAPSNENDFNTKQQTETPTAASVNSQHLNNDSKETRSDIAETTTSVLHEKMIENVTAPILTMEVSMDSETVPTLHSKIDETTSTLVGLTTESTPNIREETTDQRVADQTDFEHIQDMDEEEDYPESEIVGEAKYRFEADEIETSIENPIFAENNKKDSDYKQLTDPESMHSYKNVNGRDDNDVTTNSIMAEEITYPPEEDIHFGRTEDSPKVVHGDPVTADQNDFTEENFLEETTEIEHDVTYDSEIEADVLASDTESPEYKSNGDEEKNKEKDDLAQTTSEDDSDNKIEVAVPRRSIFPVLMLLFIVISLLMICSKLPSYFYSTWVSFRNSNLRGLPFSRKWSKKGYSIVPMGDKSV
uniref:uncharacterized protein LOC120330836 isoform X2 n=1 Tax=Styela clava TaxID=7725 RepID=UPI0019398DFB|nr:uncharacterized protein LOC120330836 isoform X2 [Styela clava]